MFIGVVLIVALSSIVIASHLVKEVIDSHTFTCPEWAKKCKIDIDGGKSLKPGESSTAVLIAEYEPTTTTTTTSTTTTTTSTTTTTTSTSTTTTTILYSILLKSQVSNSCIGSNFCCPLQGYLYCIVEYNTSTYEELMNIQGGECAPISAIGGPLRCTLTGYTDSLEPLEPVLLRSALNTTNCGCSYCPTIGYRNCNYVIYYNNVQVTTNATIEPGGGSCSSSDVPSSCYLYGNYR